MTCPDIGWLTVINGGKPCHWNTDSSAENNPKILYSPDGDAKKWQQTDYSQYLIFLIIYFVSRSQNNWEHILMKNICYMSVLRIYNLEQSMSCHHTKPIVLETLLSTGAYSMFNIQNNFTYVFNI